MQSVIFLFSLAHFIHHTLQQLHLPFFFLILPNTFIKEYPEHVPLNIFLV